MSFLSQKLFCVLTICLTYHIFKTYCGVIPDNANTLGNLQNNFSPHRPPCGHHQGHGNNMHHHYPHHHHGPEGGVYGHYPHLQGPGFGTHHHPFHHHGPDNIHYHHHHHECPGGCNHHHSSEIHPHQQGPSQNGGPIDNTNCVGDCSINEHLTSQPVDIFPTVTPSIVPEKENDLDVRFGNNKLNNSEERTLLVAPANCPPGTKFDSRTERCRKSA